MPLHDHRIQYGIGHQQLSPPLRIEERCRGQGRAAAIAPALIDPDRRLRLILWMQEPRAEYAACRREQCHRYHEPPATKKRATGALPIHAGGGHGMDVRGPGGSGGDSRRARRYERSW